jgi:hypothetical protein
MTKVNASICPNCLDLIFSRARHDFHRCSCGEIFIDGGFDYTRGGWKNQFPYQVTYEVKQSKDELSLDYALMNNQFGIIKDWKLNILDFFNVNDRRLQAVLKDYIKSKVWPTGFPTDHLVFPEHWESLLTFKILEEWSDESK